MRASSSLTLTNNHKSVTTFIVHILQKRKPRTSQGNRAVTAAVGGRARAETHGSPGAARGWDHPETPAWARRGLPPACADAADRAVLRGAAPSELQAATVSRDFPPRPPGCWRAATSCFDRDRTAASPGEGSPRIRRPGTRRSAHLPLVPGGTPASAACLAQRHVGTIPGGRAAGAPTARPLGAPPLPPAPPTVARACRSRRTTPGTEHRPSSNRPRCAAGANSGPHGHRQDLILRPPEEDQVKSISLCRGRQRPVRASPEGGGPPGGSQEEARSGDDRAPACVAPCLPGSWPEPEPQPPAGWEDRTPQGSGDLAAGEDGRGKSVCPSAHRHPPSPRGSQHVPKSAPGNGAGAGPLGSVQGV